jgi:PRTRC genetic system protein A
MSENYLNDFLDEMDKSEETNDAPIQEEPKNSKQEAQTEPEENEETDNSDDNEESEDSNENSDNDESEDADENGKNEENEENEEPEQGTLSDDDAFEAALNKCKAESDKRTIGNLAAKNPVFKYASASDEITDKEITFEALRKKYETDFPELEDEKSVSWSVTYGKTTKQINNPDKEKVFEVKAKIETSDEFIKNLKKAKTDADKNLVCIVKPFVKAQKKGDALASMPSYKGFFMDYDEALKSPKVITFVPARDGRIYEIRKNNIGIFQSPAREIGELAEVKTKFAFRLPKIPIFLLYQVIGFFRVISKKRKLEVLVHLVYNTETDKYEIIVPKQKVTSISVNSETEEYSENLIHVMDIHSHNVMDAKFSSIDNSDEKATRLYGVIGKLDRVMPEIALRASNGGKFIELGADEIFDYEATYPDEWHDNLDHQMAEAICATEGI